ncbi:MarR family winged helix-turn-helix transcriptional regulator [Sphingomonadaceae bacterium OTU29THOMA1]|nr:MarR family winged helix-turn-helix transcriptional regulator [Sphingomonadaceae bacterium OTU29THOMA1]
MAAKRLVLDDFIPYRLSITSNLVSDSIARTYESLFGLTIPEWRLIAVIAETGGITQQAIGARTLMDKVTVSRAAIALVDRGLLVRQANPEDRRSHLLELTDAGRDLYAAVSPKALDLEDRIFAAFDPAEVAQFMDMLRRVEAVTAAIGR